MRSWGYSLAGCICLALFLSLVFGDLPAWRQALALVLLVIAINFLGRSKR